MSRKIYENIYYKNCPHFTVGRVDQWGEKGYLFYEGEVYDYYEDRKEQFNETYNRRKIADFLADAKNKKIEIPSQFLKVLKEA
jgi:hypothetical protein